MPPAIRSIRADASGRYSLISSVGISVLQDFRLQSLSTLCAVFPPDSGVELRTCRTVVIAITFHEVDDTPDTETCAKCDNESLKNTNCRIKKCHNSRNQNRRFAVFCRFAVFRQNPKEKQAVFCRPALLRFWLLLSLFFVVKSFGLVVFHFSRASVGERILILIPVPPIKKSHPLNLGNGSKSGLI